MTTTVSKSLIDKIARVIEETTFGYSYRLTYLKDGMEEHTLTFDDGETHIFNYQDDGYQFLADRRREKQAQALIEYFEGEEEFIKNTKAFQTINNRLELAKNFIMDIAVDSDSEHSRSYGYDMHKLLIEGSDDEILAILA